MAVSFAIATQTIIDGPRNSVFKVTGDVLGASLPIASSDIIVPVNLTAMNPGMSGSTTPNWVRIDHIEYSITDGMVVTLQWDGGSPIAIVELYGRGKIDAKNIGGLWNNTGAGSNVGMAIYASTTASPPTDGSVFLLIHTVKFHVNV